MGSRGQGGHTDLFSLAITPRCIAITIFTVEALWRQPRLTAAEASGTWRVEGNKQKIYPDGRTSFSPAR